ncbi:MAG: hypothetical protein ACJ8LG_19935 [Massilia sp.]
MDRTDAIAQLRAGLLDAAAERDWDRLGAGTRALAPQLARLGAGGPWNGAERRALAQLRDAHDLAAATCATAVEALARRLDEMRANKEGWIAYALDNELADIANP